MKIRSSYLVGVMQVWACTDDVQCLYNVMASLVTRLVPPALLRLAWQVLPGCHSQPAVASGGQPVLPLSGQPMLLIQAVLLRRLSGTTS